MNRVIRPNLGRLACLIALPLALAACSSDKEPDTKAMAEGEILPGSISDAMLPLDTVRSQPPLAPKPTPKGKAGEAADKAGADAEATDAAAATPAPATPAASPVTIAVPSPTAPAQPQ